MKVMAFPSDLSGCSYYRIIEPIAAAERAGLDASYSYYFPNKTKRQGNGVHKVLGLTEELDGVDVVVFHRVMNHVLVDSIKFLRKAGIGVVIDLDDDLDSINAETTFGELYNPATNPRENWEHTRRACQLADVVTCSTPAIERRWGYGHGVVARNGVPPRVLDIEHIGGAGIGWSGAPQTHVDDLEVVGDGLQRAISATGMLFTAATPVSALDEVQRRFSLEKRPAVIDWVEAGKHYENLAHFDIGIAPLANTSFSRSRSAIKVLELAALGIPAISSPLPEYLRVAEEALCTIAHTPPRWAYEIVHMSLPSEGYSEYLRARVKENHTTDVTILTHIDAWELAASKAKRRVKSKEKHACPSQ